MPLEECMGAKMLSAFGKQRSKGGFILFCIAKGGNLLRNEHRLPRGKERVPGKDNF